VFDHRVCPSFAFIRVFIWLHLLVRVILSLLQVVPSADRRFDLAVTCLRNVRESTLLSRVRVALTIPQSASALLVTLF
jgi:hypothetical protein